MNYPERIISLLLLLAGFSVYAGSADKILAPGYGALQFQAPAPGTYQLNSLGKAADGQVLQSNGQETSLYSLLDNKVVLLSFIYSTCSDVNGCPLATAVFHKIKRKLIQEPEIAEKLRLLTLSFNPDHDTPAVMENYGKSFQSEGVDWQFLTTETETQLTPILSSYQQQVQKNYAEDGSFTGTFSHLLRVFLIDQRKQIRNVYSVAFLHPDTLINDIKTILLASEATAGKVNSPAEKLPGRYRAGDNKESYQQSDYRTRSIALSDRAGQTVDLMQWIDTPPLGLPKMSVGKENPPTAEKISLGRKLFYDRRLSLNNTFSCAMCHIPEQGFTSNEMATAVGMEGRTVRRNSPGLYNVGYFERLFHDGREDTLEQQIWGPLLAKNEMANPSVGYVINKIKNLPDYQGLFESVFGSGPGMETIGRAIASYERALVSANSPFDRWHFGKQEDAVNAEAKRGFALFKGKARCSVCHTVNQDHALFTDQKMHSTGVGFFDSMHKQPAQQRVQLAPGVFVDVDTGVLGSVSEGKSNDLGLYEITQNPDDRWKYKTPSLRNVALTAPYMHNGSLSTLQEVIDFYNQGGVVDETTDPVLGPLNLTESEKNDLYEFLIMLTGDNVEQIVSDAFAAPVGDPD